MCQHLAFDCSVHDHFVMYQDLNLWEYMSDFGFSVCVHSFIVSVSGYVGMSICFGYSEFFCVVICLCLNMLEYLFQFGYFMHAQLVVV